MCRILCVHGTAPFSIADHLTPFAALSKASRSTKVTVGAVRGLGGEWRQYHNIAPIWEDPNPPKASTNLLLVHARSAFRDEGIVVENNMPFTDGKRVFIFNGELRGVRIKADGRIGAEKIFNFIRRFDKGNFAEAVQRGVDVINKRTRYVRAMNFVIASPDEVHVSSTFGEDPDYFQMQHSRSESLNIVCSERYGDYHWQAIDNHSNHHSNLKLNIQRL